MAPLYEASVYITSLPEYLTKKAGGYIFKFFLYTFGMFWASVRYYFN